MAQNQSDVTKYNQRSFFLATTLVHEVAHIALTQSRTNPTVDVPPEIDYWVQADESNDRGEVRRFIEQTKFGGVLALWHENARENVDNPGALYIKMKYFAFGETDFFTCKISNM